MKINYTRWGKETFKTPHFSIINNKDYIQVSFVVWNFHWWIIINKKSK